MEKTNRRSSPQERKHEGTLAQKLLSTVLRQKLGRSQREALRTELASKVPERLPKGMSLSDIIEVFGLAHWARHYKRTQEFWVPLDGASQRVTCLEIRAADRCMVVLDRKGQRREVHLDTPEAIRAVEDDEERRLRKLEAAIENLDEHLKSLDARQENLQKQLEVTSFKIQKVRKARDRLRAGVEELTSLFDSRRNAYKRAIGPITLEDLRE